MWPPYGLGLFDDNIVIGGLAIALAYPTDPVAVAPHSLNRRVVSLADWSIKTAVHLFALIT